jgi:hypothetical protein
MKTFLLIILALSSLNLNAQELSMEISGQLSNLDSRENASEITISIWENGTLLTETTSKKNGKYSIKFGVKRTEKYKILYQKEGLVSKHIRFDLSYMQDDELADLNSISIPELSLTLFQENESADFSFLETRPVAVFKWSAKSGTIEFDRAQAAKVQKMIDHQMDEIRSNTAK